MKGPCMTKCSSDLSLLHLLLLLTILSVSPFGLAQTQYIVSNDDIAFPFVTGIGFFHDRR